VKGPSKEGREILFGVHPVMEALESGVRNVDRILVAKGRTAKLGRLLRLAREKGVPVSHLPQAVLRRETGMSASHQGVAARVSAVPYAEPEELLAGAVGTPGSLLVALDRVEDPRNLGAAVRTVAAAGAMGVLLGTDGAVGLTSAVAKTSAGALERVSVARVPRLAASLRKVREDGVRVVGLDPRSATPWDREDLTGRIIIVAGGEARGPRRSVLEVCDRRVRIPLASGVDSLNVSVAVGVVLFEAVRQRRAAGGPSPGARDQGSP
jgi:23S rRNA (guanosine2251-2'-O)-methyltransferase